MEEPLFPVATFDRVFDTVPLQEVLTLPELVAALRRFEVKTSTWAAVRRELDRIERARLAVRSGAHADGAIAHSIAAAADPEAEAERLAADARRGAKRDLRLWSPTLYTPGARRGGESVTHLGCLVLDYDAGIPLEDALLTWDGWFHVVHTTWSHRPEQPRFRVVLPLARLVDAADWSHFWDWAAELTGGQVDIALKGRAAAFALPAVPEASAPRHASVHPGPLLDPEAEGVELRPVELTLEAHHAAEWSMTAIEAKKSYVEG